jgi:hypothetical protein
MDAVITSSYMHVASNISLVETWWNLTISHSVFVKLTILPTNSDTFCAQKVYEIRNTFKYFLTSSSKAFQYYEKFALNGRENNPLTKGGICYKCPERLWMQINSIWSVFLGLILLKKR